MPLRIVQELVAGEAVLVLHGWLRSAEVAEFEKAAEQGPPPRIDLEHLAGADAEGLRALHHQHRRGARLAGASPYIQLLLERTAPGAGGVPNVSGGGSTR